MAEALGGRAGRVDGVWCCMELERTREVGLRETASEEAVVRYEDVVFVVVDERAGDGGWGSRA